MVQERDQIIAQMQNQIHELNAKLLNSPKKKEKVGGLKRVEPSIGISNIFQTGSKSKQSLSLTRKKIRLDGKFE